MTFDQTLRGAGLHPREIRADGIIRRCATDSKPGRRNGWFVLHPDGRGAWGDWTTGTGEALGHWRDESATSTPPSAAVLAQVKQQRERERQRRIIAMRGARAHWDRSLPVRTLHPYLDAKGLTAQGTAGLRQRDGMLVVPVVWGGSVISLQTISAAGTKLFWPGAPVKGGAFVLDRPRAAVTCVCEGLATGLAIYQTVRSARVVVAFDAGNLAPAVHALKLRGSVVICADDDHGTQARRGFNPGREKAANAAELIGAGVAWPEGIEGTDYADWLREAGPAAARRIERHILAHARYVAGVAG